MFEDWWFRLSRMGQATLIVTVLCTVASVALAVFHPDVTWRHLRNAILTFVFLWIVVLVCVRLEVATSRLSDPDYFFKD